MEKTLIGDLLRLKRFLGRVGIRPSRFALPIALALSVALLEGLVVAMMIPLAKGIMNLDFMFLAKTPHLASFFGLVSQVLPLSNGTIFSCLVFSIFGVSVIKNLVQYGSLVSMSHLVRRFVNCTREQVFDRCLGFGKLFFDRTNAGYLHGLLLSATSTISFRLRDLQEVFASLFMLVVYLATMFYVSWRLTMFVLLVFPVLGLALKTLIERIRASSRVYADAEADLNKNVANIFSCLSLVRSYAMEDAEKRRFAGLSDCVERHEYGIDKKLLLVTPLQEVIVLGMILLLVSAMALIASRVGQSVVPGFLVYFYVIRRSTVAFGVLNTAKASLATISGPMADIATIFTDDEKYQVPNGKTEFRGLASSIEFRNLFHAFGAGPEVLSGVSFSIEKGKLTAIVGPSGAGKSTLINLLARFYDCAPNAIFVDGVDIREFELGSIRRAQAIVSQETLLFNDTLRANITYGLEGKVSESGLLDAVRKARLDEFVSRQPQGLDTRIGDRGIQLSGGEKQRVAIARALLKGAKLLILDEATSSLDSKTEKLVQEAVEDVIVGTTAIVIAHRLSTIQKADKIIVLEAGRVVEAGSLSELLEARGRFFQYWEAQKF